MDDRKTVKVPDGRPDARSYEPPRLEAVLAPDDVEREVKYAGDVVTAPK